MRAYNSKSSHSCEIAPDTAAAYADHANRSGANRLWPFGGVPQHEDRLSQSGRFLLEAAAVGDDKPASLQRLNHIRIADRIRYHDTRMAAENPLRRLVSARIGMRDEKQPEVVMLVDRRPYAPQRVFYGRPEALPPVRRCE